MIKRKRVYICDHCGVMALEEPYFFMEFAWKGAPKGWTELGKEDLCPTCSKVYKRFMEESTDSCSCSCTHSHKTRQSVFLAQHPEAVRSEDGTLAICPALLSSAYGNDAGGCKHIGRNCAYCRREFWAHEL